MYQGIKAQISGAGHIQGIAIDQNREYIYCSFVSLGILQIMLPAVFLERYP